MSTAIINGKTRPNIVRVSAKKNSIAPIHYEFYFNTKEIYENLEDLEHINEIVMNGLTFSSCLEQPLTDRIGTHCFQINFTLLRGAFYENSSRLSTLEVKYNNNAGTTKSNGNFKVPFVNYFNVNQAPS